MVEDIDQYNRVHEMLGVLSGKINRDMDDVSGMSKRWDSDEVYNAVSNNLLSAGSNQEDPANAVTDIALVDPGVATPVSQAELNALITQIMIEFKHVMLRMKLTVKSSV